MPAKMGAGPGALQARPEEDDQVATGEQTHEDQPEAQSEPSRTPPPPRPPPPPPPPVDTNCAPSHDNEPPASHQPQQEQQQQQQQEQQPEPALKVPGELRKSSTVSFKDVCELFEIDLETGKVAPKPPVVFSLRYYIMILALMSPFVVTYSRTIINFAIIDMIEPQSQQEAGVQSGASSTPGAPEAAGAGNASTPAAPLRDNSCPVDEATSARLKADLEDDWLRTTEIQGEKFNWNPARQGLLKASYSIGHTLFQVLGGRFSEIYGSRLIMGLSSALIGLCCLAAPLLAWSHFYCLFADLLVLGVLGSFMTPALITLFSNWLTGSEKSIMLNFYLVSSRLGYALSSLLCGLLIEARLSWHYLFYSAGWISLSFALAFFFCARSRPHEHPLIGQAELDYLAAKNKLVREALATAPAPRPASAPEKQHLQMVTLGRGPDESRATPNGHNQGGGGGGGGGEGGAPPAKGAAAGAPWLAILTNVPVWAFVVTKFCVKLAGDTVQIELPAYLKRVMHIAPRYNGFINASNYVIFCASCLFVGALAKTASKRRPFGWSKSTVRKLFQLTASFGAGLALLGLSASVCDETSTLVMLMLMFFFTTFSTGGEAQIPLDISEHYAGTIHAIGSSLAISGVIVPILVGYILRDHPADRSRWAGVWMGASASAFLGGLVFGLFGEATIQPFDKAGEAAQSSAAQGAPRGPEPEGRRAADGTRAQAAHEEPDAERTGQA